MTNVKGTRYCSNDGRRWWWRWWWWRQRWRLRSVCYCFGFMFTECFRWYKERIMFETKGVLPERHFFFFAFCIEQNLALKPYLGTNDVVFLSKKLLEIIKFDRSRKPHYVPSTRRLRMKSRRRSYTWKWKTTGERTKPFAYIEKSCYYTRVRACIKNACYWCSMDIGQSYEIKRRINSSHCFLYSYMHWSK